MSRDMAEASRMIVVSVGYRLSPEVRFPEPLKDCLAAIRWVNENIWAFGGDKNRIALVGESSGGTLAIATDLDTLRVEEEQAVRSGGCVPALELRPRQARPGRRRRERPGLAELQAIRHRLRVGGGPDEGLLGLLPPERKGRAESVGRASQGEKVDAQGPAAGAADEGGA
ncbi:unnamed protein product [Scytosiphon promiscuus]